MTDSNLPPQDPNAAPQPTPAAPLSHEQDVQWGSFAHLGGILGILPSLIIWLVFKDRGSFTNTEGKEALNFQITLVLATVALWVLTTIITVVTFGFGALFGFLTYIPWILGVIFSIIAFMTAKDGNHYRYPFAIRLIK
ncbi:MULTISPECIES: DUF4870 domain-containing protein [Agromyces]|uniref:DUF4870 domain-containing protein n=2 Tax=Agromyces TaxID=33877 RepID=A0A6L5QXF6_9MICO|nr:MULTISPECIES: DUF4870 domain-containing protein [Agromyces]MRX42451.1 DUF4870 domain-containing protein [Agromyces kandeliae]RXZ45715.1 DUF4870 domain-containing protein [Agromyces binzhouensis]